MWSHSIVAMIHSWELWTDKTVTESEGGSCKLIESRCGASWVVARVVAFILETEAIGVDERGSDEAWEELVVGNVLVHCRQDPSTLLIELLLTPVRVDVVELFGNSVVLTEKDRVDGSECRLLTRPRVPCVEAVA